VLRGKVDRFKREDNPDTPHLQIRVVDGEHQAWRVAVNVLSADQSLLIFHRVEPLLSHPILASLPQTATGFSFIPPASRSAVTALDFLRAPLFDWPTGVEVPFTGPGLADDLQDALMAALQQLQAQDGELFVFGERFPEPGRPPNPRPIDREFQTLQGVHNMHMNQGNPAGRFAQDNGSFQDGGLLLNFPNRCVGLFLRFQSQWLPTDSHGNRLPNAQPIPAGGSLPGGGEPLPTSPVADPVVYIERALVNPGGHDPGKEMVVIGNTTVAAVDLTGWSIVDKNNHAEVISGVLLPAGESRSIVLSGRAAQLGNKGGTIQLKNPSGQQVHAVSYSNTDVKTEDRYIRFTT
jgi:uncharacterized protein YukJ